MITITPGQALLLLIDHYQTYPEISPPITIDTMKKLYLSGATSREELRQIRSLYEDPALYGYEISEGYGSLYKDPTRRYFETHLAYHTQSLHIGDVSLSKLRTYAANLFGLLPAHVQAALPENFLTAGASFPKDAFKKEYRDVLEKLRKEPALRVHLRGAKLEKAELLIKCALMGVISGHYVKTVVDVHRTGFYHKRERGRIAKRHKLRNLRHFGLLRSTMPLAETDLAYSATGFKVSKPAENSRYDKTSAWPKHCFAHLTQSFSNSISGTNLRQAQIMAHLLYLERLPFTKLKDVTDYFKLMISSLMFVSGGHTLFEFSSPLFIPQVMEHFAAIPGASDITFETLFLANNEDSFEFALADVIRYNNRLLKQQTLLSELRATSTSIITGGGGGGGALTTEEEEFEDTSVRERIAAAKREAMLVSASHKDAPASVRFQRSAERNLSRDIVVHRNKNARLAAGAAAAVGPPPKQSKLCIIL